MSVPTSGLRDGQTVVIPTKGAIIPHRMLNWFRRLLLRITRRAVPALDRVLSTAGGTVERLDEQMRYYRDQSREDRQDALDLGAAYAAELDEAISLAQDPWLAAPVRTNESATPATRELVAIRESLPTRLKETVYGMAELEIALDDRGWKRMVAYSTYEFSRFGIQSIILIMRLMHIKNPLIGRGIKISANYVFAGGMDVSSPDQDANDAIQAFYSDPRNASQVSHTAHVRHEETFFTDGNLFWAYFTDPEDGRVVERNIDALEISDIMTDPSDSATPWYYHRQWTEMAVDLETGRRSTAPRDEWYAALNWEEIPSFPKFDKIEGHPVAKDKSGNPIPVLHAKGGHGFPKSRFDIPKAYPALDWTRAYSEFLQNLCTTWKQLSRLTTHATTKGGAPAIAALKQTLATTFMNDLNNVDYNPPPVTGSTFISGENTKLNPLKASGITVSPEDSGRVLGMVCAAFGLGEHFFGLIDSGNLATAASLDRPTELMFKERQESWREIEQTKCRFVLKQSLRTPKGTLREAMAKRQKVSTSEFNPDSVLLEMEPIKKRVGMQMVTIFEAAKKKPKKAHEAITIVCSFPEIVQGDMAARVGAIVKAITLDGYAPIGIDEKVGVEMLLTELGYEDAHELVEEMYGDDYVRDRTIVPEPEEPPIDTQPVNGFPAPPTDVSATGKSGNPDKAPPEKRDKLTAREVAALRALAAMRRVIRLHESTGN